MSGENEVNISAANRKVSMPKHGEECPVLVKKIGKTTYRVAIHFSATSMENMRDKIKRMLRNEINRM